MRGRWQRGRRCRLPPPSSFVPQPPSAPTPAMMWCYEGKNKISRSTWCQCPLAEQRVGAATGKNDGAAVRGSVLATWTDCVVLVWMIDYHRKHHEAVLASTRLRVRSIQGRRTTPLFC